MNDKPLTEAIRDVAEELGVELAADLVRHFGGTRVYVPKVLKPHHDIVKKLGQDKAAALVSAYGGSELDVPMHLYNEAVARRKQIFDLRRRGMSVSSIALDVRCTERQVYAILGQEKDGNAPRLF